LSPCYWKTGDSMACTMVNLIFFISTFFLQIQYQCVIELEYVLTRFGQLNGLLKNWPCFLAFRTDCPLKLWTNESELAIRISYSQLECVFDNLSRVDQGEKNWIP
jgi:hypothetical protein